MNIYRVIIGALVVSGCNGSTYESTGQCDAESGTFDLEVDIAADTIVQHMIDQSVESFNDVDCYRACSEAVREAYSWEIVSEDTCTLSFSITEEINPSAEDYDPEASVATLMCSFVDAISIIALSIRYPSSG